MENWRNGVDPAVFRLNNGRDDKVLVLEDISAFRTNGERIILEKGSQYSAGMRGGMIFCHLGSSKYNEAAIMPADFSKLQIARGPTVV